MRRLSALAISTALALAAPASVLAQSAGDDQYNDPFAGEEQVPEDDPSTGDPAAPPPAPAPAPTAQPSTSAPATTLPYTGLPAVAMSGVGALLLAAGIGLRRSNR